MSWRWISKVGFEVEGGWDGERFVSPLPTGSLVADHSINGQTLGGATPLAAPHVGEAISPPLTERDWESWLKDFWPNAKKGRTNKTCGFHIHTSFEDKRAYTLLSSKIFLLEVLEGMEEQAKESELGSSHAIWERLQSRNTFCRFDFSPERQMEIVEKHQQRTRYGMLNFATGLHGTVELRLLPTFRDARMGTKFAAKYFQIVETYLDRSASRKLVREAKF